MVDCCWVGIDLHRSRSHVAVLDDGGRELLSRRIVNDPQTFLALLAEVDGESKVALEATYGWEWLADVLQDAGYELHLAPLRTKAIARPGSRTTPSTPGRSPTCCAPGCCPRPTSHHAS
jgi:transposase